MARAVGVSVLGVGAFVAACLVGLAGCRNDAKSADAGAPDRAARRATDVARSTPHWVDPSLSHQGCEPAQIDELLKGCTSTTSCAGLADTDAGAVTCTKCLLPPDGKLLPGMDTAGPISAPPDPKGVGRPTRPNTA